MEKIDLQNCTSAQAIAAWLEAKAQPECNADLGHPCDAGNNGEPCHECAANEAYWLREWKRHGKHEVYTEDEIRDCYSDPTESAKRSALLGEK